MISSLTSGLSAADIPAAGVGEKLDWDAFSARYFPGQRRHDLEALAAYGVYKQGRDWRNSPQTTRPKLTLVPNEPVPPAIEAESEGAAPPPLLAAVAAVQVWETEGGLTP